MFGFVLEILGLGFDLLYFGNFANDELGFDTLLGLFLPLGLNFGLALLNIFYIVIPGETGASYIVFKLREHFGKLAFNHGRRESNFDCFDQGINEGKAALFLSS